MPAQSEQSDEFSDRLLGEHRPLPSGLCWSGQRWCATTRARLRTLSGSPEARMKLAQSMRRKSVQRARPSLQAKGVPVRAIAIGDDGASIQVRPGPQRKPYTSISDRPASPWRRSDLRDALQGHQPRAPSRRFLQKGQEVLPSAASGCDATVPARVSRSRNRRIAPSGAADTAAPRRRSIILGRASSAPAFSISSIDAAPSGSLSTAGLQQEPRRYLQRPLSRNCASYSCAGSGALNK